MSSRKQYNRGYGFSRRKRDKPLCDTGTSRDVNNLLRGLCQGTLAEGNQNREAPKRQEILHETLDLILLEILAKVDVMSHPLHRPCVLLYKEIIFVRENSQQ